MSGEKGRSCSHSFEVVYRRQAQRFQYTGFRKEVSLGLYDYNARFYDPMLGRFMQADTIVPSPADPQSWDRYAYVKNNPLRNTDPSGHWICEDSNGQGCKFPNKPRLLPTKTFIKPLSPSKMNGGYDWHDDNGTSTKHEGVDISPPPYDIRASGFGYVHSSDACSLEHCDGLVGQNDALINGGYGNLIVIEYPFYTLPQEIQNLLQPGQSIFVLYAHLQNQSLLNIGDIVIPGQIIGQVGNSGNSTGEHLHLEIRVGYTNELPYLEMVVDNFYSENALWVSWWQLEAVNPHMFFSINR